MAFDKRKFVTSVTQGGMEEKQAELLADAYESQLGIQIVEQRDLTALEDRIRSEISVRVDGLRTEMNDVALVTRLQVDELTKDFRRMEARVEGGLKIGFRAVKHGLYASTAGNMLTILITIGFLVYWLE